MEFDKDVLKFIIAIIIFIFITHNLYLGYQPRRAMLA